MVVTRFLKPNKRVSDLEPLNLKKLLGHSALERQDKIVSATKLTIVLTDNLT